MDTQEEKRYLNQTTLSRVFLRFGLGFGAGGVGTIVLGIVLLFTWSIVGDVLMPTSYQIQNEFGETLSHKEQTHPLFLSIVVLAVFLATLVSNLFYCTISSTVEEKYKSTTTNLTQVFLGNVVILVLFIVVYLIASSKYGALGVALTALAHAVMTTIFTFMSLEILSTRAYLLVSLYGSMLGIALFLMCLNFIGGGNPTILTFLTLPILMSMVAGGSGIVQMFYSWLQENYNNDFLHTDKRFGTDYGREENIDEIDILDFDEDGALED